MQNKTHKHFLSLPPKLSKSGQRPALKSRVWFVAIGVLAGIVLLNAVVAAMFEGVIYPGVSVAGHDLSFKTRAQALKVLRSQNLDRHFTLKVGDKVFTATNTDLGAQYDLGATVDAAYNVGRNWPLPLIGMAMAANKGSTGYSYNIDKEQLSKFTSQVINSVGRDPVNASVQITYGTVSVVPDQDGLRIDQHYLDNVLATALTDGKDQTVTLSPVAKKADILAQDTSAAQAQANDFLSRQVSLTYNGKTFAPDKTALGHMIVFNEVAGSDNKPTLQASISRDQVLGYLQSVANQVDVAPTNRKVLASNGTETELQAGQNGSTIDQQAAADEIYGALSKNQDATVALKSVSVPYSTVYQRPDGALGGLNYPQYIEVNLSTQRLFAWQNGQIVLTAPTVTGKDSAPTVTGVFAIYAKERNRYLNGAAYGYDYNVFVQYWMPFYGGFGLHDASWRPDSWFGDQAFHYNGSHGCVNLWTSTAAFLYSWAPVGTPVWVHT